MAVAVPVVFLPLTTTFSAPIACSSQYVMPGSSSDRKIYAFDPGQLVKDPTALACQPEEVVSWWAQDPATTSTALGGETTFICPNLYIQVASITDSQNSRALIACCPSSYEFVGIANAGNAAQCKSTLKPGILTFITTGTNGLYTRSTSLLASSSQMFAVQVNGYITRGTVSSTSSGSSTTTGSSSISSNSISATPNISSIGTPPSPSQTAPSEPSGLSTGAKAGIGGGVGAVALLAILGALLWYRRRHRNKAGDASKETEINSAQELSAEQPGPHKLGSRPSRPIELP